MITCVICEDEENWSYLAWPFASVSSELHTSSNRGRPAKWDSSTCEKVFLCLGSHPPVLGLTPLVQGFVLNTQTVTLHEFRPISKPQFIHLEKGTMQLSCLKDYNSF